MSAPESFFAIVPRRFPASPSPEHKVWTLNFQAVNPMSSLVIWSIPIPVQGGGYVPGTASVVTGRSHWTCTVLSRTSNLHLLCTDSFNLFTVQALVPHFP